MGSDWAFAKTSAMAQSNAKENMYLKALKISCWNTKYIHSFSKIKKRGPFNRAERAYGSKKIGLLVLVPFASPQSF